MVFTKLADDETILHVMNSHWFSVGLLMELAPHEDPGLLAPNVNRGQAIGLPSVPLVRRVQELQGHSESVVS